MAERLFELQVTDTRARASSQGGTDIDAAQAIAAHLGAGPIGIEDHHRRGLHLLVDHQYPIGADTPASVVGQLRDAGLRAEANLKDDRVGYKIRQASLQKIPYVIVVGEKEAVAQTVNVRSRDHGEQGEMSVASFLESLSEERRPRRGDAS